MSNYTIHQIRHALDKLELENQTIFSIKDLESKLKIIPVVSSIVQTVKAVSNNYPSIALRNEISGQVTREGYVQELIPVISLGRRQGHTSAIIELIQNTDEDVVVVLPNSAMLREYGSLIGRPRGSHTSGGVLIYSDKARFVTQSHFAAYENIYATKTDPLIILDCACVAKPFLESGKVSLTNKYVIVGN